ncbi:Glycosyl transferases group 1 [Modestobacter sp. DSM 44400]|uniref:glycosyltransferase family protein n=1 Tax=Modestobacter sp. DSM 44400 TaxID=1550230 RepID=UPI00089BB018|nr:glycosyltransferase [Modestobacter sp. DSM 44400]SDX87924.1 Glycosyl transferases group 1 [Modestobacter sp. DSM 44400]
MNVLLAPSVFTGSQDYRMAEPARAVQEADPGIAVTVTHGLVTRMIQRPGDTELSVASVDGRGADVVVLQLPKTEAMLQCLRLLQAQGIAVVVEVDDLLSAVPYGHSGHDALVRGGVHRYAVACAREADLVTVSTPALLKKYAPHGRGAVVPNAVPRRIAELPPAYERDSETVTIGWTGSVATHPYDLQVMESGLQQALDRSRGQSRFMILGEECDARDRLRLSEDPVVVPWVRDVDEYVTTLGELFDIGLAPLREDRFNTCKSWLKVLEYAARGVYAVRSPTVEYERLALGRSARRPRDWAALIAAGVQKADQRREIAAADRERVLAGHLVEQRWADAWRLARENRSRTQRIVA